MTAHLAHSLIKILLHITTLILFSLPHLTTCPFTITLVNHINRKTSMLLTKIIRIINAFLVTTSTTDTMIRVIQHHVVAAECRSRFGCSS